MHLTGWRELDGLDSSSGDGDGYAGSSGEPRGGCEATFHVGFFVTHIRPADGNVDADGEGNLGAMATYKEQAIMSVLTYLREMAEKKLLVGRLMAGARQLKRSRLAYFTEAEFSNLIILHEVELNEYISSLADLVIAAGGIVGLLFGIALYRARHKPRFVKIIIPSVQQPRRILPVGFDSKSIEHWKSDGGPILSNRPFVSDC